MDKNRVLAEKFNDVEMFKACEQCGRCSSACPITGVENFNIRRILRHVELDLIDELSDSPFPWLCTTCGRCEEACPNGIAILDIIRPLRSVSPEKFIPDSAPCTKACPAGIDVPGYLRFISQGKPEEAYKAILEKVPFPGILGRVCTHPCENFCNRRKVNEPISICALKRYAADRGNSLPEVNLKIGRATGHKVAVIGAGPTGLTAAFYLRKNGHEVTIFEARSKPGGMMRYGIPSYRLPEDIMDKEIDQILRLGIELKTDKEWGRDFDFKQLKEKGFEAILIAVGLQASRKMDLEGLLTNDLLLGVDFLIEVNKGEKINLKEKVIVVGGGNVAIDVARVARRLGAKEIHLICLESVDLTCKDRMPAQDLEIEQAKEEGVIVHPCLGIRKILTEKGKVAGLETVQCTSVINEEGKFAPEFGEGPAPKITADMVIIAIGQSTDQKAFFDGLQFSSAGTLLVDSTTLETKIEGIFASGDIASGPSTVIEAIQAGRRVAASIDKFLEGEGMIEETLAERPDPFPYSGKREKGFADLERVEPPTLPFPERFNGFVEVERCLSDEQAINEAKRCLQCDLELRLARETTT